MTDQNSNRPPALRSAEWLMRPETRAVFRALNQDGHEIRAVGGAVRNTLMGLPATDVDLATTARPDQVVALATAAGLHVVPTGLDHGTVTVIANHIPYEVTTLREDAETFGRHASVVFTDDWAADARRRDFTINALYADAEGTLYDPLGGYADVLAKTVRFIGCADDRIQEDYLRILRFYRFSAEYVTGAPDAEGHRACVANRAGLSNLSGERISAELKRLLVARGAVSVVRCMGLPGILEAAGLPAHPFRTGALERLARIEARLGCGRSVLLRMAMLWLSDVDSADALYKRLRLSRAEFVRLTRLANPDRVFSSDTDLQSAKQLLYRLGADAFRDRVLFDWAKVPWDERAFTTWKNLVELPDRWPIPSFAVTGADLLQLGYKPDKKLGSVLKSLEDAWIASDFALGREQLLRMAHERITDAN